MRFRVVVVRLFGSSCTVTHYAQARIYGVPCWFVASTDSLCLMWTANRFSLAGFWKQAKWAFKPKRIGATIIFFASMIMTLVAALVLKITSEDAPQCDAALILIHHQCCSLIVLAIIFVIIQFLALVWYTASYIRACQCYFVSQHNK